jgi:hypothetical protein
VVFVKALASRQHSKSSNLLIFMGYPIGIPQKNLYEIAPNKKSLAKKHTLSASFVQFPVS